MVARSENAGALREAPPLALSGKGHRPLTPFDSVTKSDPPHHGRPKLIGARHRTPKKTLILAIVAAVSGLSSNVKSQELRNNSPFAFDRQIFQAIDRDYRTDQSGGKPYRISVNVRIRSHCVLKARQPAAKIIVKSVAGNESCALSPQQRELREATRDSNFVFEPGHPEFKQRYHKSTLEGYDRLVGQKHGLEWREFDLLKLKSTRKNSPMKFIDRTPLSSLVGVWCYAGSMPHWLCTVDWQPRPYIAIQGKLRYGSLHLWRELTKMVDKFVDERVHVEIKS